MRTTRTIWTLSAALGVAVLLAACGQEPAVTSPAEATTSLAVVGTDGIAFDPEAFSVPAGEDVSLELGSEPAVVHDLVVVGAGDQQASPSGELVGEIGADDLFVARAEAGETVTASFRIEEPGTYEVHCSVPGHRQGGMVATLTVVS